MGVIHAETRRFTVHEFHHLWELGVLGHERLELIDGQIVRLTPQGEGHSEAILQGNEALVLALHATHHVGVQLPLQLSEHSAPEPDFVILPKTFPRPQPVTGPYVRKADLVIEVAMSSLDYDRDEKASLYARCGIQDYWIVNVPARQVEVHREPVPMPGHTFGYGYQSVTSYMEGDSVSPLVRPDASLAVRDLL